MIDRFLTPIVGLLIIAVLLGSLLPEISKLGYLSTIIFVIGMIMLVLGAFEGDLLRMCNIIINYRSRLIV